MRQVAFGDTGATVSELCLGTMTWGTQTPEEDAHRQMDMALEAGIDIVDTAEMYPVNPISAETVGSSEEIIGRWIAANRGRRAEVKIATKISGLNSSFVRVDQPITSATLRGAFEDSLRRLQTDFIDVYQLHWPNRGSYHFRQMWDYDPSGQDKAETLAHMADVLEEAGRLVDEGKLGAIAMSNESAWGLAQWLRLAEERGLPRVQSVQNEYSLLCRYYDWDLGELAVNEAVTLLAFSPLATGLLTGKYQGGAVPEGSRMAINGDLGGRVSPRVFATIEAYQEIATRHGLDLVQMALAWQQHRPFAVSAIFGATHSDQLPRILGAADLVLSDEVLAEINAAHRAHPMPY